MASTIYGERDVAERDFRGGRGGVVFKDDKLYIFHSHSVTVARTWPAPMAWRKTRAHNWWHPCRLEIRVQDGYVRGPAPRIDHTGQPLVPFPLDREPSGQLLLPFLPDREREWQLRRAEAFRKWFDPVPEEVRQFLRGFRTRQYHLLSLLARAPAAWDLRNNRALLWMLASVWAFNRSVPSRRGVEYAKRWCRWRRRRIAAALGWRGGEATVRLLARVPARSISINALLYLRDAVAVPEIARSLWHVPRVNRDVVALVSMPFLWEEGITPNLMAEVGKDTSNDTRPHTAWLLRDVLGMFRHLGRTGCPRFRSVAEIQSLHDELVEASLRRPFWTSPTSDPFPPPPVPGSKDIVPLTDARALYEEGKEQHNCVASYADRVVRGEVYIYRVLHPERATLSIRRSGRRWVLDHLKVACNRKPQYDTYEAVIR